MLISHEYIEQNRRLHETNRAYGTSGYKWADQVWKLAHLYKVKSALDYGSGKCTLREALIENLQSLRMQEHYACKSHPWLDSWRDYDPCIAGLDMPPEPADLVICGDVLEHIEPDCIDDVLDDLRRLTKKAAFLVIATRPAAKTLPDGRNAHLIVRPIGWWLPQLMGRWNMHRVDSRPGEFLFIGSVE